jgi:DNA-binding GntR family transcriptional regulator
MTEKLSIDAYILDTLQGDLVGHDHSPSAYLVYLQLWNQTAGRRKRSASLSLQDLAHLTGLSKSTVQGALRLLKRRKLVHVTRKSATSTPVYEVQRPWL